MYCIKCGVEMADGEKQCPLCKTKVYHPEYRAIEKEETYPSGKYPERENAGKFWAILFTVAFLFSGFVVIFCDYQFNKTITWAGFVTGALTVIYVSAILPFWFGKRNPVIFVPASFFTVGVYLSYINYVTDGQWFLKFALPVTAGLALSVSALVALAKYLRKGKLFIFGGFFLCMGAYMLLIELMMTYTFASIRFVAWSIYPLVSFGLLGAFLIFLGICRPAREIMERKFFI